MLSSLIFVIFSAAQDVVQNNHQSAKNVVITNGTQNGGFDSGVGFYFVYYDYFSTY